MLNINQNFDLKAPVFNFDRDYFNSVEELNAYDTSNVPNHFVTNVAGMLYLFTKGKWLPMIGTYYDDGETDHYVNLGCDNAYLDIDTQNNVPFDLWLSNTSGYSTLSPTSLYINNVDPNGSVSIEANYNGSGAGITVSGDSTSNTIVTDNKIICGDDSFKVDIYGDEGRMEINDAQGRFTNYSASGFSVQTKNDTKSIKLDIDDTEADERYGSTVNVSLTHDEYQVNINALDGFRHSDSNGSHSNLYSSGLYIGDGINRFYIHANLMTINNEIGDFVSIGTLDGKHDLITLGTDHKFKISCPTDNTEGATITGIKSLTAFANPSATKVWATDGSTVDLTTKADASALDAKANASDVLLKKSASGGYYIESNSNELGWGAFAANMLCTASGSSSFAEGCSTKALGYYAHAEGYDTTADGTSTHAEGESTQATQPGAHAEGYHTLAKSVGSHAEGYYAVSNGSYSHAEGNYTEAAGFAEHALGTYNVVNKNAIHSVGIGNATTRKNAEYIYAKDNKKGIGLADDPKNGYKYLIGVGGYDGISTDNTTYKSVQEVIADLTTRIEQLETKVRALEAANTPA